MARLNSEKIVIAGGGLAGLSLAAGLRLRGVPVEVHEAGSYPRHRVCGEFISGVSPETLDALGIRDVFTDALRHRSVRWSSEGFLLHEDLLPSPALGISRYELDQRLKSRVEALGGLVHEKSRLARGPEAGRVWAAGRPPVKSDWLGLKAHFSGLPLDADLEMHLGSNGYAGLAGIEGGKVNVCGLFRTDHSLKGSGVKLLLAYLRAGGNAALAERLAAARVDPESYLGVAGFALGRQAAEPGVCAVGDAESMIPPFTGNGMSMAFQSAESALDPLEAWSRGRVPWGVTVNIVQAALRKRFRRRLSAANLLHPFLLKPLGRSMVGAMARNGVMPFHSLFALVR
jgi:2-polyprenyl-6-methoxyphenol hydroxylase-like FAD-dependent oxidoreductase